MKNNPFFKSLMAITFLFAIMFSAPALTGQNPFQERFVPVTQITDVTTTAFAGTSITLSGIVVPANATGQHIIWSIDPKQQKLPAGPIGPISVKESSLKSNILKVGSAGTITVWATIKGGKSKSKREEDYTQMFVIQVVNLPGSKNGHFYGNGINGDPYLIVNEEDLRQLSELINAGTAPYANQGTCYRLVASFTMFGGSFKPIGTDQSFKGHFDGNHQTITNPQISNEKSYTGLFGLVQNGTIKNLGLVDVNINGIDNTGGVAGALVGVGASITGCYVTGHIFSTGSKVGGIVGMKLEPVSNCYTTCSVYATSGTHVGGIAGESLKGISNCWSSSEIGSRNNGGGIVGRADTDIVRCMALNPFVGANGGNFVGRVSGGNGTFQRECVAWEKMKVNDAIISGAGSADSKDGLSINVRRQISIATYVNTYCPSPAWSRQTGMLPGFRGNCVPLPSYLQ